LVNTTNTTEPVFGNLLRSPEIDSRPCGPVQQTYLTYRPAGLHRLAESLPRNRFLGSINVYKYGLTIPTRKQYGSCQQGMKSRFLLGRLDSILGSHSITGIDFLLIINPKITALNLVQRTSKLSEPNAHTTAQQKRKVPFTNVSYISNQGFVISSTGLYH